MHLTIRIPTDLPTSYFCKKKFTSIHIGLNFNNINKIKIKHHIEARQYT